MNSLSWSNVVDRPDEKVEFGACHEYYAWRPHTNPLHKFTSLHNAFHSERDSITSLLQNESGNRNAKKHPERGRVLFVALWYKDSDWVILSNKSHVTLVPASSEINSLEKCDENNPDIERALTKLFDDSPRGLRRGLDDKFYSLNILGSGK